MTIREKDLVAVREYYFDKGVEITLEQVKEAFDTAFISCEFPAYSMDEIVAGSGLFGKETPTFVITNIGKGTDYIQFNATLYVEKKTTYLIISAFGKGEQVKPKDLMGFMRKVRAESATASAVYNRFGRKTSVAVGYAAGRALRGGVSLAVKGIKLAMRDKEAYEKEMGYYQDFLALCDELVGVE